MDEWMGGRRGGMDESFAAERVWVAVDEDTSLLQLITSCSALLAWIQPVWYLRGRLTGLREDGAHHCLQGVYPPWLPWQPPPR